MHTFMKKTQIKIKKGSHSQYIELHTNEMSKKENQKKINLLSRHSEEKVSFSLDFNFSS